MVVGSGSGNLDMFLKLFYDSYYFVVLGKDFLKVIFCKIFFCRLCVLFYILVVFWN